MSGGRERFTAEAGIHPGGVVSFDRLRIYTGILGQIGDIVMFTATARRLKELYPNSELTVAVGRPYEAAGRLVAGLPYVDRVFVTQNYFERLTPALFQPWERGWPVDLRGDDEVAEERRHHLILPTRPRPRRERWWETRHQVAETAEMVGVPGPIDLRTEVAIPLDTRTPDLARGKVVLHNDPRIDPRKAWSWEAVRELARALGPGQLALLGAPGPEVPGTVDLRGRTTLAEAAAAIRASHCFVGIDSGLMWIAGALQSRTVGLYGTEYLPKPEAVQPVNPNAIYLNSPGAVSEIPAEAVRASLGD